MADPYDVCECGDYRRDHVNGTGRCRMPNDLNHGFRSCERFVLDQAALRALASTENEQ